MSRILWTVGLLAGVAALRPSAAEAQARGTLQVFAQVVDAKAGSEGVQAARAALSGAPSSSPTGRHAAPTLARVSVAYTSTQQPGVVVTVDYSSN
jgi:hypothetical protein